MMVRDMLDVLGVSIRRNLLLACMRNGLGV
jgi:hypothetical protein